jgi:Concanavalin A-like lectin/glucanases superfamily/Glycosyl hydrolases family 2, sugar binding domain/Glycosyl hydrolases family 2/Glycosyl hydrolases family 2, TIM barrel domain
MVLLAASRVQAWQMKQATLMTQWASQVDTNAPLPEYPRPQMVRTDWMNLNGIWQFQAGATNDPVPTNQTLSGQILVPYPMESAISGVMEYHEFSWYRRLFSVPPAWNGRRIILHLDAVNWQSQVYINGQSVGSHAGGYDPASYDITPYLNGGTNELIVQVYSPEDNGGEPRGKQTLYPGGIMYTSSSGIWQPVWLEPVDSSGVQNLRIIPDVDNSRLRLTVNTYATNGVTVSATVLDCGAAVSSVTGSPDTELDIPIPHPKLWSPNCPFLYDLDVSVFHNGMTNDTVASYFGMRKIAVTMVNGTPKLYLNNHFVFGMGPLDQGFWPDGLYTAPTDAALKYDLQEEKALGFNTVRKHIKVERARWYYWADKLGLMVWQDMPSCNSYTGNPNPPPVDPVQFIAELTGMVTNHWNHPSIIMWDIFNEAQGEAGTANGVGQTNTAYLVNLIENLDPDRICNAASGGNNDGVGQVYDAHSYPYPAGLANGTMAAVDGEYGGIGYYVSGHLWNPSKTFGNYTGLTISDPNDIASVYDSYINMIVGYKANTGLSAAIYTELTDVEIECNGLLTYDRILKPDPNKILTSNQKAITGYYEFIPVLPTSQTNAQMWRYNTSYTTSTVPANWYAANFNDSGWSSGPGGFGTSDPGAVVRTTWNTSDIWLRRSFNAGALPAYVLNNLVFYCYHDEDCEIYINGVLAGSASGFTTSYAQIPVNAAGINALIPNGTNLIAVHCHQTTSGQYIDVGMDIQNLVANTMTVPTDYVGYWPLDETSGTIAHDASFTGNNGTVNGAVWNADGKINGCLSFNGVNDEVQISNSLNNDFSMSFWIRTTQTAGTGQWYQGAGLVDGDVPGNANDFGVSLLESKLAFGVGNPDTTIVSTNSINDGTWHQCVVTRRQATGIMDLYVDGHLEGSGAANTNSLDASANLLFGAIESGGGYFNGNLDEVKLFDRALGANEVAALYYDTASPSVAPTHLTATAGNGQVQLIWWELPAAKSYNIKRSLNNGGLYAVIASSAVTGYTDTNVVNGTTYYYVVSAVNSAGDGTNSLQVSATPSTLAVWFKADAITGLADGQGVETWEDSSGNGYDATQAVSGQQPAYVAGAINGLPAVRFNSAGQHYMAFNRPVQGDFTMIIVYDSSQNNQGTGTTFYSGAGLVNGDQPGSANDFGISLNANGQVIAGTGNPDTSINSGTGYNDGKPHVVTFERTQSTGALVLYVDGTQVAAGMGGTNLLTAPPVLDLGAVPSGGGFLNGDVAEVQIYDAALSNNDRVAVESALKGKYGLSGGAAPAIPTGLTAMEENGQVLVSWTPAIGAANYNLWHSLDGVNYTLLTNEQANSYVDSAAMVGVTNYYEIAAVNSSGASANSTAVNAVLPLPVLGLNMEPGLLAISWPAWATNWMLYSATDLTPPVAWSPVTNEVGNYNGQFNVNIPIGSEERFFRLTGR